MDDQHEARSITKLFLSNFGFVVHSFSNAEDALGSFDPAIHDLVVTNNIMTGMTGREMAHIIKMRSPRTPVLMYCGKAVADDNCLDFIVQRPASLTVLKQAVDQILIHRPERADFQTQKNTVRSEV